MKSLNLNPYYSPSMLDYAFENSLHRSKLATDILAIFLGSLFLVWGSQISIPLSFTPVPITGQTFSVLVMGSMLGATRAPLSVLLYIFYGLVGLPVFADHSSGLGILIGPTGGYIAGFILCGYFVGKLTEKGWDRTIGKSLVSMTVGHVLIFVPGLLWLIPFVGADQVLAKGFYPFVLGGVVKTALAASTSSVGWLALKKLKNSFVKGN